MKRLVFLVLLASCKSASVSPTPPPGQTPADVTVSSASFATGAAIPKDNTCDGADQSPQLSWTAMPDKTKSIALIVDDPDAPNGTFTHWILWNVKGDTRSLGAGGNGGYGGGVAGTNDFDKTGYSGPCPPKGKLHHYHFRIYGLDTMLSSLKPSDKRSELDKALNGHVIAQGELVGTFEH